MSLCIGLYLCVSHNDSSMNVSIFCGMMRSFLLKSTLLLSNGLKKEDRRITGKAVSRQDKCLLYKQFPVSANLRPRENFITKIYFY